MSATMSEESAGLLRGGRRKVVAFRPDLTSTTLPTGIAHHDPDANGTNGHPRTEAPSALPVTVSAAIADINLHPANPRVHYPEGELEELAKSMQSQGLIQPITVRHQPDDRRRYQLVCGHRRLLAARRLKWKSIPAHVRDLSDRETLLMLTTENSHRSDLNPIEEARLVDTLTRPLVDGGGGMTDAEVAAIYGHASESWAVNKKRLLKLPEPWLGRVLSGEMDETKGRHLLAYIEAPRVLKAIDEAWSPNESGTRPLRDLNREVFTEAVEAIVKEMTFRLGDKTEQSWWEKGRHSGKYVGWHKCLVDVEQHRDALEIVKLPIREGYGRNAKIAQQECVTNFAALCRLQAVEIKKRESAKARKGDQADAKQKAKAKAAKKELTPAELRHKRAQADRVLGERIKRWKFAVKRFYTASVIRATNEGGIDEASARVALLILLGVDYGGHATRAAHEGVKASLAGGGDARFDGDRVVGTIWSVEEPIVAVAHVAAEFLWPTFADPYAVDDFKVKPAIVDRLVADFGLTIAQMWSDMQDDTPKGAGVLFDKFLSLFTSDQLRAVAQEWDVHIPESATKSGGIGIVRAKLAERTLKLPACLAERGAGRGARAAGKKNRRGAKARR